MLVVILCLWFYHVDPVLTGQSCVISMCLCLCPLVSLLNYACACAFAYAYVLVKTSPKNTCIANETLETNFPSVVKSYFTLRRSFAITYPGSRGPFAKYQEWVNHINRSNSLLRCLPGGSHYNPGYWKPCTWQNLMTPGKKTPTYFKLLTIRSSQFFFFIICIHSYL